MSGDRSKTGNERPVWALVVVRKLSRFVSIPTAFASVLSVVWIFLIMLLINADVFGRFLFNAPLRGVPEIVSLSIVGIVFLQLADALRHHRFIRSDVIIGRLMQKSPRYGNLLDGLYHLLCALMFAVILRFVTPKLASAWEHDTFIGTLGHFTLPLWPFLLIIVTGTAFTLIQYLLHAANFLLLGIAHFRIQAPTHQKPN